MEPNPAANGDEGSPRWEAIPAGVRIAPGVDIGADDPAREGTRRRCIAQTAAGHRCRVNAVQDLLLCTAHAGRLDSSAGGHAKARKLALVRDLAQREEIAARLGARAVIASAAIARASDLKRAFDVVLDGTIAGDKQQARTLLGYLTAAFPEGSEDRGADPSGDPLTSLSTDQLRALAFGSVEPQTSTPESE